MSDHSSVVFIVNAGKANRVGFLYLFLMFLMAMGPLQAANVEKPNLVVIFTDDQTFKGIGYHNPDVKTPHMDALAAQGMIFERAYVASPICVASRSSMMLGQTPQQHRVIALDSTAFGRFKADPALGQRLLARQLAALGYETALYGKSHLGDPQGYGFSKGQELDGYDDVDTFRQAGDFIRSRADKAEPFFLWIAPRQPHLPLHPTQEWLDLYSEDKLILPANFRESPTDESVNNQAVPGKQRYRDSGCRDNYNNLPAGPPRDERTIRGFMHAYYATISHLDQQVGDFVELLREQKLMENTMVIYMSDNGYHLGSHGLGNKITMHEESVRVPMFAFGAGVTKGAKTKELISTLDWYPTLIELAGGSPPESMGKSLLPVLHDPKATHREVVFSECVGQRGKPGEGHRMARRDRWKLILSTADEEFLYDQQEDPFELHNRIHDPGLATVVKQLREDLAGWMKQIGDRPYPAGAK